MCEKKKQKTVEIWAIVCGESILINQGVVCECVPQINVTYQWAALTCHLLKSYIFLGPFFF